MSRYVSQTLFTGLSCITCFCRCESGNEYTEQCIDTLIFGDQMGTIILVSEGIQSEEVNLSFLPIDEYGFGIILLCLGFCLLMIIALWR